MPWDRKRLLGYVETIKLILGVTDECQTSNLGLSRSLVNSAFSQPKHVLWVPKRDGSFEHQMKGNNSKINYLFPTQNLRVSKVPSQWSGYFDYP